jgi:TonB family protein
VSVLALANRAHAQPGEPEIVHPAVVHDPPAEYPKEMLASGKHADVVLIITIDKLGNVADVAVDQSGGESFDKAAIDAVKKWSFTPASRNGVPVSARIKVPFHFAAPEPVVTPPKVVTPPPPEKKDDEPEDVRIEGSTYLPSRGPSDYEIRVGKLAAVPRTDAGSLLRMAPGVFLQNQGGTGHPYQIYLRGFDAREGQDLEFTIDGVPINEVGNPHGNGLVDTHFIIPELVLNLRVVEGPYAPQQGNFAVAGSALYEVGLADPGFRVQATYGSFGTARLLASYRPEGHSEHTFAAGELYTSDGFGQNRASNRATAMAGWEGKLGSHGFWRVLATSYATHYGQAGVLRVDDVASGRKGFYDTYDDSQAGDSARHSLGLTLGDKIKSLRLQQSAFVTFRDFRLRSNLTGFLNDPQETWQSPHGQRGDLADQQATTVTLGGRGSARQQFEVGGLKQEIELGYFARVDLVDAKQQRDRFGTTIPYKTDLDLGSTLTNIGAYVDVGIKPVKWLTLRGGLRADFFHYRVTNRCAQTSQSSIGVATPDTECFTADRNGYRSADQTASTASGLLEPRATALLGPFRGFTLAASVGTGARSLDPQYVNQGLDTPYAKITSYEGGATFVRPLGAVEMNVRSTFFSTHVSQDLLFNETEGRPTLASGTTRTGWAGSVRATGKFFDVASSLTLVRAKFDDTGLQVPYAPGLVFRADGALFGDLPVKMFGKKFYGTLGVGVSYVAPRPLPLSEKSDPIFLVDVGASLRWRWITLGVQTTNLIGTQYKSAEYNYVSDFRSQGYPTLVAARHFIAGEPRAVFGTLTFQIGDGS